MENTFLDNLIKHYERYVFTIVRQQWNTKDIDPLLMEDVMQEIWLRCLKAKNTMEAFDELQTKAYLSAIARNTTRSFLKKQQKNEKLALNNEWDYSETVTINGLDYSFNYSYIKDAKWLDIIVYCFDKNVVLDFGYSCTPCDGKDDKTILPKKEFIKIIKNLKY